MALSGSILVPTDYDRAHHAFVIDTYHAKA